MKFLLKTFYKHLYQIFAMLKSHCFSLCVTFLSICKRYKHQKSIVLSLILEVWMFKIIFLWRIAKGWLNFYQYKITMPVHLGLNKELWNFRLFGMSNFHCQHGIDNNWSLLDTSGPSRNNILNRLLLSYFLIYFDETENNSPAKHFIAFANFFP